MATTIAQLDIDVDEVTKKAGETRKKLMEIAEEMKALKKNFAEGNISVEEYTQQLSQLTAVQKETQKDLRTYESIMQANVAANGAAMQSNTLLTGSIRELSAALSQNKKAYSEMSAEQRESAEGKALLATIQEQDKAYKELQKSIGNTQVEVEPMNPFANRALTTEEIAEKQLLKKINYAAKQNGGRPPINLMDQLVEFYKRTKNYQKVAETYETIQTLNPKRQHETDMCYYYSKANNEKLSDKWGEEAYKRNPTPISAYNLAIKKEDTDPEMFERLMKEAIIGEVDSAFWIYGKYLLNKDENHAKNLLNKAFDIWYPEFERGSLADDKYHRLINVAQLLGKSDIAKKVREAKDAIKEEQVKWFGKDNLATDRSGVDRFELPNNDNFELPF